MKTLKIALALALLSGVGCSRQNLRGIADGRTEFRSFLPMKADPARDGLRAVNPYFRGADRAGVLRAIEKACEGGRRGSSVYDGKKGAGYYVNCNPRNPQLLNGYIATTRSAQPHSH